MVKASVVVLGKAPATGAKLTVDIFKVKEVELPELADGELLIRVLYASVDPYMHQYSLHDPSQLGSAVRSRALGVVEASKHNADEYAV
eukprot:gene7324-2368_t